MIASRLLIGAVLAAGLAGCATRPPPPPAGADLLSGRLALRSEADPPQSMSASFELEGRAERGLLRLSSPLGTRLAEAGWQPGEVWLRDGQGERRYADLDSLARQALGEPVPLAALPDWLRGRPWPQAASTPQDGGFRQLGWQVDVRRQAQGRIELRRIAEPLLELRVLLDPRP